MTLPIDQAGSYVGLYGSVGEEWRQRCKRRLDQASISWHDPSDSRWDEINHDNGDEFQGLIDTLVGEEHQALLSSGCVIFYLAGGPDPPASLAARCELGLLAGSSVQTFLCVAPQALGRNYAWAVAKQYPHLVSCESLDEAIEAAERYMKSRR